MYKLFFTNYNNKMKFFAMFDSNNMPEGQDFNDEYEESLKDNGTSYRVHECDTLGQAAKLIEEYS